MFSCLGLILDIRIRYLGLNWIKQPFRRVKMECLVGFLFLYSHFLIFFPAPIP